MWMALVIACQSPWRGLEDRWWPALEACQPPRPFLHNAAYPEPLSDECREHLIADLGIDEGSFQGRPEGEAALEAVLDGAYQLLGREMGLLSDLREDDLVRDPLIEELRAIERRIGAVEVAQAVYNLVAYPTRDMRFDAGLEVETGGLMSADTGSGEIVVGILAEAPGGLPAMLVHEAAHVVTGFGHVLCWAEEGDACDEGWDGANGFHVGAAALWRANLPEADPWHGEWEAGFSEVIELGQARIREP